MKENLKMELNEALLNLKKNKSLKNYKENNLFNKTILDKLTELHELTIKGVYLNTYLTFNNKTIEFDVLIKTETLTKQIRWIGIELKDNDINKVIEQGITRRDFVDYSYIILNTSIRWLAEYLIYVCPKLIREYKLGFFVNNELFLNSKFIRSKIKIKESEENETN